MKVVGIDIGATGIRTVRLERRFREFCILSAEERLYSNSGVSTDADIIDALSKLSQSGALQGDILAVALPGDRGYLRVLDVPPADSEKTALLVKNELDGATPNHSGENVIIGSQILRAAKGTPSRVLAATVPADEVSTTLAHFQTINLDPQLVTCEAAALSALAVRMAPQEGLLLINMGRLYTTFVVVSNQSVVLVRTIKQGTKQLAKKLSRSLQISPEEWLRRAKEQGLGPISGEQLEEAVLPIAAEIRRTLLGLRAKEETLPEHFVVCGEGALLSGLSDMLVRPLSMSLLPFDLKALALKPRKNSLQLSSVAHHERFARALGLAFLATERHKALSLRQGALAFRGDISRLASQIVKIAALLLVLLFLAGVTSYARYSVLTKEKEQAEAQLKLLTKEVIGKELADADTVEAVLDGEPGSGAKPPWPETTAFDLLVFISQKLPKNVQVEINKLEIKPKKLTLSGEVENAGDVDAIIAALEEKHPCFKEFKPGSVKQIRTRDGETKHNFTLNIDTVCP